MRSSIILLIVVALIAAICVSSVLLGIVKAIEIAVHNLDKVAEGELNFAVSEKILKRNDEIGINWSSNTLSHPKYCKHNYQYSSFINRT